MMQVRGMDAGKKLPVLADNGENAHNVAAHIRMHFGQNEDVEFVSHQGRNFAALAYALYLQREQQDNQIFGLQQFDAFFGGGEATQAPARKTLLQIHISDSASPRSKKFNGVVMLRHPNETPLHNWPHLSLKQRSCDSSSSSREICVQFY